ncbi:hypothetical protein [Celerinatantimonas sp. YJH-8]
MCSPAAAQRMPGLKYARIFTVYPPPGFHDIASGLRGLECGCVAWQ